MTDGRNILFDNCFMTVVAIERVSLAVVYTKTDEWIIKGSSRQSENQQALVSTRIWCGAGDGTLLVLRATYLNRSRVYHHIPSCTGSCSSLAFTMADLC